MPEVIFQGPEGRIEGRYHQSDKYRPHGVALVLHPHPMHGGTMNNKISYNIFHAFANAGFSVLRFNFRGVGKSQGKFDNGIGELSDAAAALDWLQQQNENANSCWISGFSFGSWIALQLLMRRPEIDAFIAASPPVNKYDFSFLSPCPSRGLIIQGDSDDIVSEEAVSKLYKKLSTQKLSQIEYEIIKNANHYFKNNLDELNSHLNRYINGNMDDLIKKPKTKAERRRRSFSRRINKDSDD